MARSDIPATFAALRETMLRSAGAMVVTRDEPGDLSLDAPWPNPFKPKEAMWFGGVRLGKAYAAYHLFPLYVCPTLKARVPEALVRRMQGKSCFNFKTPDAGLFAELEALTLAAARLFAEPTALRGRGD